jgi:hypothetical protein
MDVQSVWRKSLIEVERGVPDAFVDVATVVASIPSQRAGTSRSTLQARFFLTH